MILIIVLLIVVLIVVYMLLPYSPIKKEYWGTVNHLNKEYELPKNKLTQNDLKTLPKALQNYFIKNGYLDIETASSVTLNFNDADFSMGVNKANIKIDYTVYAFVKEPTRMALIDSKLYGIPFQGIDINKDGKTSTKGVFAKHIKLFDNTVALIDPSYLAECLLHPSLALQDKINYKEIDDYSVEATLRNKGIETIVFFYFNNNYEIKKLVDEKRFCNDTKTFEKWTAIPSEYKMVNGINTPTRFQAIWNFNSGDLTYFDGRDMKISYN